MKCLALLACDKIIIDKDGAHSLINVMLSAAVTLQETQPGQTPKDIEIPANAVSPNQWWIYAQWEPSSNDVGKSFKAVFQIFWPNGEKLMENKLSFTQLDSRIQQTTVYIGGFPVGQQGAVKVTAWLDSVEGHRVSDIAETHIVIEHRAAAAMSTALPKYSASIPKP
jgi:hypothetical protein